MPDEKKQRHMPVLLIAPGAMTRKDIARAERLGGFCIVECKDAEAARFVDPPITVDIGAQARASMSLTRHIIARGPSALLTGGDLVKLFVDTLLKEPATQVVPRAPKVKP